MPASSPSRCAASPGSDMDPLLTILKRLTDHGVEFVVIGSFAAVGHGAPIVTRDVDVCAPLVRPNLDNIVAALRDLHPYFRFRPATSRIYLYDDPARLVGFKNIYLVTDLGLIDILGELPDVGSYEKIAATSVEADF